MAWSQVSTSMPHVAYATTGFALLLFGAISLFIKEKLYLGEASVATIYGLIVGPHALDWFSPAKWGNVDYITLEISRIVLVVQIFAVAVELPKKYMLKHAWSVFLLLVPVMTFGWLLTSVFIWKLVPTLRWIEALSIAACVTATDPVLASAVVGKGKFAKRVPGHLRNILSAESGCNDGMAFPFVYLALNIMDYETHANEIAMHFICISVLYECVLGCLIGAVIGYCGRHLIKFAEKHNLIDRESFLCYYFCMAIFSAGVGTVTGTDDLLVAFAAGAAFSWDGWFARKTEESHVSNVIDVLLNTAYFVYFGSIIPWPQFNNAEIGIRAWKLVIIAILVLLFRRLPIVLALKPVIPDIKTWREALFCGHFGPIGVGGLFIAILARAELETGDTTPLRELPAPGTAHYYAIACIWPITCFLVLSSIIVHGSSIAVFTLGKRLNNIAITMTYNTTGANGPSWIKRLPNGENASNLKLERVGTQYSAKLKSRKDLRKRRKAAKKLRKDKKERDPEKVPASLQVDLKNGQQITKQDVVDLASLGDTKPEDLNIYQTGPNVVIEDKEGNFVDQVNIGRTGSRVGVEGIKIQESNNDSSPGTSKDTDQQSTLTGTSGGAATVHIPEKGEHVNAYQVDDNVVVENEDGEIIKRYKIVRRGAPAHHQDAGIVSSALGWFRRKPRTNSDTYAQHPDVEHTPEDMLVPVDANGEPLPPENTKADAAIRQHVQGAMVGGAQPASQGTSQDESSDEEQSDSELSDDDDLSDVSNEEIPFQGDDEDDDDKETEVERNRRLAALGGIHHDDDIEDVHSAHEDFPARRINTIPEEEEKEDNEHIKFNLPRK